MNFGEALAVLQEGGRVARSGWNGKDMHVFIVEPEGNTQEYVAMHTVQGTVVPWLCSQTDMLSDDWDEV